MVDARGHRAEAESCCSICGWFGRSRTLEKTDLYAGLTANEREEEEKNAITITKSQRMRIKRAGPGRHSKPKKQDDQARRRQSKVLKRADSSSSRQHNDTSGTPDRLRVMQDTLFEDRYHREGAAGDGINGVVYFVKDKLSGQKRVLKSLDFASAANREAVDELINEMEVYLLLDHPNICRLLEVFIEEDCCHLIMENCEGRELFDRWSAKGSYTEADASVVLRQMTDAMVYMHDNSICHRDLKLENWVYTGTSDDSRLKLIDFGFSKKLEPDAVMDGILGTAFYIAPEVLKGTYDFKCDVWSLGVIMYMLLTGEPPIGEVDDSDRVVMAMIKRGDPVKTYTQAWKKISPDVKELVLALLTKDPEKRPTMKEVAAHKWLTDTTTTHGEASELDPAILENLRAFGSMNLIKRAAFALIAYSMSTDESDMLEAQFKKLDKDGSGTVTMTEMVEALKETLNMDEAEAERLFSKLDLKGLRRLQYSEFLAAACQRRFLAQESLMQEAFKRFDVDKSGVISVENLRTIFGDEYNGTKVEEMIAEVDYEKNGVIEYEEFVRALMDMGTASGGDPNSEDGEEMKKISRAIEFTSVGESSRLRKNWSRGESTFTAKSASRHHQDNRNRSLSAFDVDTVDKKVSRASLDGDVDVQHDAVDIKVSKQANAVRSRNASVP